MTYTTWIYWSCLNFSVSYPPYRRGKPQKRHLVQNQFGLKTKGLTVFAFLFPFLVLMGWVLLNEYHLKTSHTLILPVEGHDPRDLISGHYLSYKIKYGLKCPKTVQNKRTKAYMCFQPEKYLITGEKPKKCTLFIKGQCVFGEFKAGVNRHYIPEKKAQKALELFRQATKRQVQLSITSGGRALTQDILLDGESLLNKLKAKG